METLNLGSSSSFFHSLNHITYSTHNLNRFRPLSCRRGKIRAVGTDPQGQFQTSDHVEPPMVDFSFVNSRFLLNCAGGGTCGTCLVEKPKNWRLACQTTVGIPDSRGMPVVQQLPEWKAPEWGYEKVELSGSSESSESA